MKRYSMKASRSLVLLALVILTVATAGRSAFAQHGLFSVGQVNPFYFGSTGPESSRTISFSASGDLTDCTAACYVENITTGYTTYGLGSGALGNQNTYEATGLPAGIYRVCCDVGWPGGGVSLTKHSEEWGYMHFIIGDLIPTSVDKTNKAVHYACGMLAYKEPCYGGEMQQQIGFVQYTAYAPDCSATSSGAITVPDASSWTSDVIIAYPNATYDSSPYTLVVGAVAPSAVFAQGGTSQWWYCQLDPNYPPIAGITYSPSWMRLANDTPTFRVNGFTTSTTSPGSWPRNPIEPAYGDSVTYFWERRYNEFHAKSVALFQEFDQPGGDGTYYPSQNSAYQDKFYKEIPNSEAFFDDQRNNANVVEFDLNAQPQRLYTTGELTWPGKDENDKLKYYPEFPSGRHKIGIKYDDGHVELIMSFVDVNLSIYDVYTDSRAPFYIADDSEGKTSIYYKMSAPAQEGEVDINIGGAKTVQGTPNKGQNVLADAWDGTTSTQEYVDGGSYALTFNVTALVGSVGLPLSLGASHNYGFTPAPPSNESLTITYSITEPVRRPQATEAKATAVVYDSNGAFVRLLANEQLSNIGGNNVLAWDGKDEQGHLVSAGTYTITFFAKDNAGVGCESSCGISTVTVEAPSIVKTEIALQWPAAIFTLAQGESLSSKPGFTDSGSTVFYSVDSGTEQSAVPDYGGLFYIDAPQTAGLHTIILRTDNAEFPEKTISASYFVNGYNFQGTTPGSRHNTESGNVPIIIESQSADTVDVLILSPFDQAACIDVQNPVPIADVLNGQVSTKITCTLATGLSVSSGSNTVNWDGKDDSGLFVTPGVYDILVRRQNTDQLLSTETTSRIVVERPTDAPLLSNISASIDGSSVSVSWHTDVATTGSVIFESDGDAIGKVRSVTASTNHTVWLPRIEPGKDYDFYVLATNPTASATAISERQSFSTDQGITFGTISAELVSSTEAKVSCALTPEGAAAVEYAEVGPNVSVLQWIRVEQAFKDEEHSFTLAGLQPDAEYAYRIIGSEDQQFTKCTKSAFRLLVTKTSLPSLEFIDIESGQVVQSISQITVRATDSAHARYSPQGIARAELFVDGQQVTSYTKVIGASYVDYVFDATSLNVGDGLHQIDAVAYDDYWQSSWTSTRLLVDSQSSLQMASVSSIGTLASQGSTSAAFKERRKAQAQTTTVELVFADKQYDAIINHTFVRTNVRPPLERGFYPLEGWGPKGIVWDDSTTCGDGEHTCNYYYTAKINRKELRSLNVAISADAGSPCPTHKYALISIPTNSTGVGQALNCVTWAAHVLKASGIDPGIKNLVHVGPITQGHVCNKYCYRWVEYWPFSPADTATYANLVREARKKAGKLD